jgi:TonB family protein
VALYIVDVEYTEAAFQAKYSGTVVLRSVIDATGAARDICVARGLGLGLNENAIEAVQKWKFRPGQGAGIGKTRKGDRRQLDLSADDN